MNAQKEEEKEKKQKNKEEENHHHHHLTKNPSGEGNEDIHIEAYSLPWHLGITTEKVRMTAAKLGMPSAVVKEWLEYIDIVDYMYPRGDRITGANFHRSMRMYFKVWLKEQEKLATKKLLRQRRENNENQIRMELQREREHQKAVREKSRKELHELKMQKIRDGDTRTAKERAADAQEAEINKRKKQWIADRINAMAESRARRRAQLAGQAH